VLRPHRIAIGCYDADGTRTGRTELDVVGARTPVPALTGRPAAALLLLNDDDLTYAKIRFDPASLAALRDGLLPRLASPVARALCWSALWDLTRDAELPAADFAAIVLAGIGAEPDIALVQLLLRHTRTAVDSFLPSADRPAVLTRLAAACRAQLDGSAPGGEAQVAFVYAYAGWLASPAEIAEARGWLTGHDIPPGLVVDADLRWALLQRLAALGEAGEAEIAAEEVRDGTSTGSLAAATARAARPGADAKRAAWDLATSGAGAHLVQATVAGFWQPEQVDVLRPYGDRYFDLLPRLWRDHGPQVSRTLAARLYPLADAETLRRSTAAIRGDGLHPAARRILLEQTDHAERVLAARTAVAG
jgi:aminopeptidase N